MNNKKKLVEQRNLMLSSWERIIKEAEIEKRGLSEIDQMDIANYKNKISNIDAKLKSTNSGTKLETRGLQNMKNNKLQQEKTNIESFLRRETNEESRSLEAATVTRKDNGDLSPTSMHEEIILKLGESSPAFAAANKIYTQHGDLKIARETNLFDNGFIGELEDASLLTPSLDYVKLTTKRVGAAIQLTKQLAHDSGVDIVDYASGVLARSVGKAVERGMLLGHKTESGEAAEETFKPIADDESVQKIELGADEINVETLLELYTSVNPAYLGNSMLVVSRSVFNKIMKFKDGDGTFLVFRSLVSGKPGYLLFGSIPVFVSDVLGGSNVHAVFGDFSGYTLAVKQDMQLQVISGDTTQALAGGILTVLDTFMDGAVTNPEKFVVIKDPEA